MRTRPRVLKSHVNPSSSAGKPKTTKNHVGTGLSHQNMTISPNNVGHLEKVRSNVRQKLGRQQDDDILEIDVNMMIWGMFMSATTKAAVHLGQDYQEILTYHQEHGLRQYQTVVCHFTEIDQGSKSRNIWNYFVEQESCQQQRYSSFLIWCVVSEADLPSTHDQERLGQDEIDWFLQSPEYRESDCVHGKPVVFEWKISQGYTTCTVVYFR